MVNSKIVDDNQEVVTNRVPSYYSPDGKTFKNNYQNIYTLGDGGLFTNIDDMARWAMNFYNTKAGDQKDIELTTQKDRLTMAKRILMLSALLLTAIVAGKGLVTMVVWQVTIPLSMFILI